MGIMNFMKKGMERHLSQRVFSPLSGVFKRFWKRILGIWSLSRFRCCPFRASSVECPWYLPGNPSSPLMLGKDWAWSTGRASNQAGACEMAGRVWCMEAGCTAMGEDEVKELEGQGLVAVGVPFWDLQHCNMRIACLILSCWLATPSCSMFFVCGLRSSGKPNANPLGDGLKKYMFIPWVNSGKLKPAHQRRDRSHDFQE